MNPARYQELLGRLLDDHLSDSESEELACELNLSESLRHDLRQHLILWEIWSQNQAPERSSEAFLHAWKTRLRTENEDADAFPGAIREKLEARQPRTNIIKFFKPIHEERRRARLAWAASLLIIGLTAALWCAVPRSAHALTIIKGEAVCTACVLHESNDHAPAIRVIAPGSTNIFYLDRNEAVSGLQDYFCAGPASVVAEGKEKIEKQRHLFDAKTVTIPAKKKTLDNPANPRKTIFPI